MVRAPLHFHGRIPVPEVAPLTYRDGVSQLELVYELSQYLKKILHPSLQSTVDQVVADAEKLLSDATAQYVDGVQEFQRIHDRFMSDVNASLIALNDTAVSDLVDDATSLLGSILRDLFTQNTDFRHHVATSAHVVSDDEYDTLQTLFDDVPPHTIVELRKQWTIEDTVTITKPVKVTTSGGSVTITTTNNALEINSSDVTLSLPVNGPSGTTYNHGTAITTNGTIDAPVERLTITGCTITGFGRSGMDLEHVHDFRIENNTLDTLGYAGVQVFSGRHGMITKNTIRNITQPGTYVNSYGIALTQRALEPVDTAPYTQNVTVTENLIDGVPGWEGIDTHGGRDLVITNNTVLNTRVGIALVGDSSGSNTVKPAAPQNVVVSGNYIDSTVNDGSRSSGVQVAGRRNINDRTYYATGITITGNTVKGHGSDFIATAGGIFLRTTDGANISGNTIIEPANSGIHLYIECPDTLILGNTVVDVWAHNNSKATAIDLSEYDNSSVTMGNVLLRQTKQATRVNVNGFRSSANRNSTQLAHNMFAHTSGSNVLDAATTTYHIEANRISFDGSKPPVRRPSVADVVRGDQERIETVLIQLRSALSDLGLIQ